MRWTNQTGPLYIIRYIVIHKILIVKRPLLSVKKHAKVSRKCGTNLILCLLPLIIISGGLRLHPTFAYGASESSTVFLVQGLVLEQNVAFRDVLVAHGNSLTLDLSWHFETLYSRKESNCKHLKGWLNSFPIKMDWDTPEMSLLLVSFSQPFRMILVKWSRVKA